MESHTQILAKVSQLAVPNADLVKELASLEQARVDLDRRFEASLSNLHRAIRQLPAVINVLMLERQPPQKLPFIDGLRATMRCLIIGLPAPQHETLSTVEAVMADMSLVEVDMRVAKQEATKKKIATADLACRAAEHLELCSSVGRTVSDSQRMTQTLLDSAKINIASAQQQIEDSNSMLSEMTSQARRHDEQAEGNDILLWATCWIPIVNLITIPVALSLKAENNRLAQSCRETATRLNAEIATITTKTLQPLKSTHSELSAALVALSAVKGEAEQKAHQATALRDQARLLTGKYEVVTARVRDVTRAMGHLGDCYSNSSSDSDCSGIECVNNNSWDQARNLGLTALRGLLVALKEGGLMEEECLAELDLIRRLDRGLEVISGEKKGVSGGFAELGELEF